MYQKFGGHVGCTSYGKHHTHLCIEIPNPLRKLLFEVKAVFQKYDNSSIRSLRSKTAPILKPRHGGLVLSRHSSCVIFVLWWEVRAQLNNLMKKGLWSRPENCMKMMGTHHLRVSPKWLAFSNDNFKWDYFNAWIHYSWFTAFW